MSIFDRLKQSAVDAAATAATAIGNKRETFTFAALPESLAQLQALPEAALDTPFQAAVLTVLALCAYAADRQIGTDMLNWLRGPRPLSGQEISFLNDRFRDGKTYLPFTYFAGSTPDNNYTPNQPYTIRVESNHVSGEEQGYMKLFIPCGGANSPRPIKLRQRGSDGKWFLWEQYLLTGVRTPKSAERQQQLYHYGFLLYRRGRPFGGLRRRQLEQLRGGPVLSLYKAIPSCGGLGGKKNGKSCVDYPLTTPSSQPVPFIVFYVPTFFYNHQNQHRKLCTLHNFRRFIMVFTCLSQFSDNCDAVVWFADFCRCVV